METIPVLDKIWRRPHAAGPATPGRVPDPVVEAREESSPVPATIQKEFVSPNTQDRPASRNDTPTTCLHPQFRFQDDSHTSRQELMLIAKTDDVRGSFQFDFWTSKQMTCPGHASCLELQDKDHYRGRTRRRVRRPADSEPVQHRAFV